MVVGFSVVALSAASLLRHRPSSDFGWLAVLTLLSGFLPVKLPKVSANISVSETFVFCGTLLFGPAAGTILVFLDVTLVWARLAKTGVLWHRMLFSMAANPLSIWIAAQVLFEVAGTVPLSLLPVAEPNFRLIAGLVAFTVVYFLLNSSLLAVAIGLEQRLNPLSIWSRHFSRLWLNYWAGAAVAALLVSITHKISVLGTLFNRPIDARLVLHVQVVDGTGRKGRETFCRAKSDVPENDRSAGTGDRRKRPGHPRPHSSSPTLHNGSRGSSWRYRRKPVRRTARCSAAS